MPIYQLAHYQVKAAAVDKVKAAIQEFVGYLEKAEPGTRLYWAWQHEDDPTRFVHIFEAVYTPELVSQGVQFVDYNWVAGKR